MNQGRKNDALLGYIFQKQKSRTSFRVSIVALLSSTKIKEKGNKICQRNIWFYVFVTLYGYLVAKLVAPEED